MLNLDEEIGLSPEGKKDVQSGLKGHSPEAQLFMEILSRAEPMTRRELIRLYREGAAYYGSHKDAVSALRRGVGRIMVAEEVQDKSRGNC